LTVLILQIEFCTVLLLSPLHLYHLLLGNVVFIYVYHIESYWECKMMICYFSS